MDSNFQIQNIKFMIENMKLQIDNIEKQNNSMMMGMNDSISEQLFNLGLQIFNVGIQTITTGKNINCSNYSEKFITQIKKIKEQINSIIKDYNMHQQMMQQQMMQQQMMQQQMMQQQMLQQQQMMQQMQQQNQQNIKQQMQQVLNGVGNNNPQSPQTSNTTSNQQSAAPGGGICVIFRASGTTGQNGAPIMIQCMQDDKVSSVIEKYRMKSGDNDNSKKFIFNAKNLNPSLSIAEAGITHNANIFVVATKGIKGAF